MGSAYLTLQGTVPYRYGTGYPTYPSTGASEGKAQIFTKGFSPTVHNRNLQNHVSSRDKDKKLTAAYLHFVFPLMTMPSKFPGFLSILTRQVPALPSTLSNFFPHSILISDKQLHMETKFILRGTYLPSRYPTGTAVP